MKPTTAMARAFEAYRTARDRRAAEMAALREGGSTLDGIGRQYGLTRERVRQILAWWARQR